MAERQILTSSGGVRVLDDVVVGAFASRLRGALLRPSDPGYDTARTVWNGMVDKRPALIARCTGTADVVECVRFAREHDLLVSVRGGGHNYVGKSVCNMGLMIDLSPMKDIHVDPERCRARAQGGARLGELDRETYAFGLVTPLGVNTDTGIAGLTLGGGYGWLDGKHALACDNLVSAEVVGADGRVMTASAAQNEDLYWGVRGAGANLGIVTSLEYSLHPLGSVLAGLVVYPLDEGKRALRILDEFSASCPDDVTTLGLVGATPDGDPTVSIGVCYCGPPDRGEEALKPLRTLATPLLDSIALQPFALHQTLFDEAWKPGRRYYNKSSIVRRLSEPAIETLIALARTLPTPLSVIAFQQLHGAASRVGATETAFPHRFDHFSMYVHPATDDAADDEKIVRWGREAWDAMQPFVERAVYVNALEDALDEGEHRVREAYGPNYERLVALKKKYDPTNFFASNQNLGTAARAA